MPKYFNILFALFFVLSSALGVLAQVKENQSRLNIGKNPGAKTIISSPVSSYPIPNDVPSEIKVNKNSIVTEFYRDLLLNKESKNNVVITPKAVYEPEKVDKDRLFTDEHITISNIYPNPANDYATIDYQLKSNRTAKVSFINLLGGSVAEYDLKASDSSVRINTRNWDNGMYFYQLIVDGRKVATKKLLVRHN